MVGMDMLRAYKIRSYYIKIFIYVIALIIAGGFCSSFIMENASLGIVFGDENIVTIGLRLVIIIMLGYYLGTITVVVFKDETKGLQALVILLFSLTITIYYFLNLPQYIPNEYRDFVWIYLVTFVLSLLGCIYFINKGFRKQDCEERTLRVNKQYIRRAAWIPLIYVALLILIIGLKKYVAGYTPMEILIGEIYNIAGVLIMGFALYGFTTLDIGKADITILGPSRSGKTVTMAVIYGTIVDRKYRFRPTLATLSNKYLQDAYADLCNRSWPRRTEVHTDIIELPYKVEIIPKLLERCCVVSFIDYPGGFTRELAKIENWRDPDKLIDQYRDLFKLIRDHIKESKKIVFVVSGELVYDIIKNKLKDKIEELNEYIDDIIQIVGNAKQILDLSNIKVYLMFTQMDRLCKILEDFQAAFEGGNYDEARRILLRVLRNNGIHRIDQMMNAGILSENEILLVGVSTDEEDKPIVDESWRPVVRYEQLFEIIY